MKGRNSTLIELRNRHLIRRYYFWYELERKRLEDALDMLVSEFFLDKEYILSLIRKNNHLLKELKAIRPNASSLKKFTFSEN